MDLGRSLYQGCYSKDLSPKAKGRTKDQRSTKAKDNIFAIYYISSTHITSTMIVETDIKSPTDSLAADQESASASELVRTPR